MPLIDFDGSGFSHRRLAATVDTARESGFGAISASDHLRFPAPFLDGLTALAAMAERSGEMKLMTTVALVTLRGPVPLARALAGLGILSGGRAIAGVGPGSSAADYEAVGVPFGERWPRFAEATRLLRAELQPAAVPLWIGSWGSRAGLRRVARLGDGWLASAYNTTPESFAANVEFLGQELDRRGRQASRFPHALVTMWTHITAKRSDAQRVLSEIISPLVGRNPAELGDRICIGGTQECAELLARYAHAGCQAVHFWPVGDERRQIELIASEVMPRVSS